MLTLTLSACSGGTSGSSAAPTGGSASSSSSPDAAPSTAPSTANSQPPGGTPSPSIPATVTLAVAGDVHFAAHVAALLRDPASVWRKRLPELRDADFSLVNLETAITERGKPANKAFTFRAPATALTVLKEAGVDAVSMANNHAADFGKVGVEDTLAAQASGVLPIVGFGADDTQAYAPLSVDVKGLRVAVLAASEVDEETARDWAAGPDSPGIALALDPTRLATAVREAAADHDLVVVQLHWGTEGTTCPNARQVATVRALSAAGADVIVGTHAHRPQGSGWAGRVFVGYGTGNFIWYNTSPNSRPSGVLEMTVDTARARERDRSEGAPSPVTAYTWVPKYISSDGVPRDPQGSVVQHLQALAKTAIQCSGLAQSPG